MQERRSKTRSARTCIEEAAVEAAKEFLQKIFNAMRIEVVMEKFINKNEGMVTFKLHGSDMGILIGKHGQTLDSLQYLTNLVANKNSAERIRIVIDIEDYRERRVETLNRLALRLADKVKRTGERVVLEPMNPHERKIIHVALQNDRRITTLSEGEEPYRRVVIELKNNFLNFKPSRFVLGFSFGEQIMENTAKQYQEETISAVCTALGEGAIGIIRISGEKRPCCRGGNF